MRIPLAYPKMPDSKNCMLKQCVVFEKYDGTNIHWVTVPGYGWTDYGTRRDRFPLNSKGIEQFENSHKELAGIDKLWDPDGKLEKHLAEAYGSANEIVVFTEYFGANSFAGAHNSQDKMELVIFDVQIDGVVLAPQEFIEKLAGFNIARVLYKGKYSGRIFDDVREGKYNVKEGVVVKGLVDNEVYMVKIKTNSYLERLKRSFGDLWSEYWE